MAAPTRRRAATRSSACRRGWRNSRPPADQAGLSDKNCILFLIKSVAITGATGISPNTMASCQNRPQPNVEAGGVLQITGADFGGEARRLAFPDDARVFEHIDAVGVRQREGDVLLAEEHRDRRGLPQPLQRLGQLLEDDRR